MASAFELWGAVLESMKLEVRCLRVLGYIDDALAVINKQNAICNTPVNLQVRRFAFPFGAGSLTGLLRSRGRRFAQMIENQCFVFLSNIL
jgi:hypothetical protein